jgi:hypothetical protein
LTEVLDGEITTAEEFRTELAKTPLSAHFVEKPKEEQPRPSRWKQRLGLGVASVAVMVLVGFGGYKIWQGRILPVPPPPGCEDCPGETKLREGLIALSQVTEAWDTLDAKRKAADFVTKWKARSVGTAEDVDSLQTEIVAHLLREIQELDRQLSHLTALHRIELHPNKHFRAKEEACLAKIRGEFETRLSSVVDHLSDLRVISYGRRQAGVIFDDLERQMKEYSALTPTKELPSCYPRFRNRVQRSGFRSSVVPPGR